ncbi:ROK family protein [Paenibacillus sp. UNC499MF]|uniref:ROK family protein n=1 Tax=Paenibacillus sp. UNC499MF TaxID=1502751 RepID=UPI00089FD47D|nr:ROK family protein [Paenibacillus sp. UNC499MF]SEG73294.1 glucokinase [Paenibacillus sp. UNC499MF]
MSFFIGVDLGGTNIVCGLLDEEFNVLAKSKQPTEAAKGSDYVLEKIAVMVETLLVEQNIAPGQLKAVGIGTPGFIDPVRGVCVFASNLRWSEVPVSDQLGARLGVPVFIDNDVRMYVYGEAMKGPGRGYEHVLGITLGTGMSAGLVNNGQLYYGGGFMAGEIGHIRVDDAETTPCGCGLVGCLETIASATGIVRQVREALAAGRESILGEWFPGEEAASVTAADVSRAYDEGDRLAIEVMNHTGKLLGRGLSYAVTMYSPDALIIGGGASLAGERLFKPMREELQKSVYKGYWERLTIHPGTLIDDGGVIGSAAFAANRAAGIV